MDKMAGPLPSLIDLQVEVQSLSIEEMSAAPAGESSAKIRERVIKARKIQEERYKSHKGIHCNAQMTSALLQKYVILDDASLTRLRTAMHQLNLSARAYNRILKVARTIADLEGSEIIKPYHIAEAISYRNLDRDSWFE